MKIKEILSEEGKEQKISAKGWVRTILFDAFKNKNQKRCFF